MDLRDCYALEDFFPKSFADYEERSYGILFYNTDNKGSYDSNHAVVFKEKMQNLSEILFRFTARKGLTLLFINRHMIVAILLKSKQNLPRRVLIVGLKSNGL